MTSPILQEKIRERMELGVGIVPQTNDISVKIAIPWDLRKSSEFT